MMSPEAQAAHDAMLRAAGLPSTTVLVAYGNGRTLHVAGSDWFDETIMVGREFTWCNMFWSRKALRTADLDIDATRPICGACLRTQNAAEARMGVEP